VQNGLYAGKKNAIGNDGLWQAPEGHSIVVEVKTTDAYRIPLDIIAKYRVELGKHNSISGTSSILIIVGREDTGELEAQVRGSRHAWDIRLISVEALVKLVAIKENSEETETGKKIRSVLVPVEYTRVDSLVEVVFAAASDAQEQMIDPPLEIVASISPTKLDSIGASASEIQVKRDLIFIAMTLKAGVPLIKKSRAMYWSADHRIRVACAISKHYALGNDYWYAFHTAWLDFLSESGQGYFVLGCMDLDRVFAIPIDEFAGYLPKLNTTARKDGVSYWHVKIDLDAGGHAYLNIPKEKAVNLEVFAVNL